MKWTSDKEEHRWDSHGATPDSTAPRYVHMLAGTECRCPARLVRPTAAQRAFENDVQVHRRWFGVLIVQCR
jgi:hypothetical protein